MGEIKILWADDEIDLLKPHILFLEEKGYKVFSTNNGDEALEFLEYEPMDIVFLDEQMPGLSGLETLSEIKEKYPSLPVIMITKSEEEHIMEDAIGSKISDYLIKPVNPNQILLSIKKNLDTKRLVSEKTMSDYQQEFRQIGMRLNDPLDFEDWKELYKKLIYWEIELDNSNREDMFEILSMQKEEANRLFCRYYERNYIDWLNDSNNEVPLMSHQVFPERILPQTKDDGSDPLFVICIDNLRYDQWRAILPELSNYYRIEDEDLYYSILPTATSYSRNALFSGLMPTEVEGRYGKQWDREEGDKEPATEEQLLNGMLKLHGKNLKAVYKQASNLEEGRKLASTVHNLAQNDLVVLSFNFVDMLTHSKTEMDMVKELAEDESAYRSVTKTWFAHSPLLDVIKKLSELKIKLVITTDHGNIKIDHPVKVIGDKTTNTNLRYKQGKNLNFDSKDVFVIDKPELAHLPKRNVSSKYIFARERDFLVYPNNMNYHVGLYKDTFQHGGISIEEILIPLVFCEPK